jgi:hypothetical protein
MSEAEIKNKLPTYQLTAFNFAEESINKIHSDEVAAEYGFNGGLVPGIAVYAYMTYPVVERLGLRWLERGTIISKFVKPIYTGDLVYVQVERGTGSDPNELEIQVLNDEGTLCAVGSAGVGPASAETPKAVDYPRRPLPETDQRTEARATNLPPGTHLGSLDFHMDFNAHESKVRNHYLDNLVVYKGPEAIYHPAYLLEQANYILMENVNLGPWIHTRSEVQNFSSHKVQDKLTIRGCVTGSYEKRGHELVDLDLAIFDSQDRGIANVKHTAIIRLKPPV